MTCPPVQNYLKGTYVDNNAPFDKCLIAASRGNGTALTTDVGKCFLAYAPATDTSNKLYSCITEGASNDAIRTIKTSDLLKCLTPEVRKDHYDSFFQYIKQNTPDWDQDTPQEEAVEEVAPTRKAFTFRKRK